jgi:septal ring factor EnvC (AmiA/AmiB activator)
MKYFFILLLLGSLSIVAEDTIFNNLANNLDHLKKSFVSLSTSLEKPIETQKELNTYLEKLKDLTENKTLTDSLRETTVALQKLMFDVPEQGLAEEPESQEDLITSNEHINNLARLKYFDLIARIGMIFSKYPTTTKEQKETFINTLVQFSEKTKALSTNIKYFKNNNEDIYNNIYSSDVSYIENLELIISALNSALNNTESLKKTYAETTEILSKVANIEIVTPETDDFSKLNNSLPILNLFVFYVPDTNLLKTWKQSLETIAKKFENEPSLKSNESVNHFIKNSQTALTNIETQLKNLEHN